jgi:hypothetical protein
MAVETRKIQHKTITIVFAAKFLTNLSELASRLVEQLVEQNRFTGGKGAKHGFDLLLDSTGSLADKFKPGGRDDNFYPSAVRIADRFNDQVFMDQLIDQAGSVGGFIEHAFGEFFDAGRFRVAASQDPENVELLQRNLKRLEYLGNPESGPGRCVKNVDVNFVVFIGESFLFDFFFDLHWDKLPGLTLRYPLKPAKLKG